MKRKPSAARIAAEKYTTKPLNKPQPVRSRSVSSVPVTTSTSNLISTVSNLSASGTLTVKATKQETEDTLKHLLDLGDVPDADTKEDNSELVPLMPSTSQVPTTSQVAAPPQVDTIKDVKPKLLVPRVLGTAVKIEIPVAATPATPAKKKSVQNCGI